MTFPSQVNVFTIAWYYCCMASSPAYWILFFWHFCEAVYNAMSPTLLCKTIYHFWEWMHHTIVQNPQHHHMISSIMRMRAFHRKWVTVRMAQWRECWISATEWFQKKNLWPLLPAEYVAEFSWWNTASNPRCACVPMINWQAKQAYLVVQLVRDFHMYWMMHFGPMYKLCTCIWDLRGQGIAHVLCANITSFASSAHHQCVAFN